MLLYEGSILECQYSVPSSHFLPSQSVFQVCAQFHPIIWETSIRVKMLFQKLPHLRVLYFSNQKPVRVYRCAKSKVSSESARTNARRHFQRWHVNISYKKAKNDLRENVERTFILEFEGWRERERDCIYREQNWLRRVRKLVGVGVSYRGCVCVYIGCKIRVKWLG